MLAVSENRDAQQRRRLVPAGSGIACAANLAPEVVCRNVVIEKYSLRVRDKAANGLLAYLAERRLFVCGNGDVSIPAGIGLGIELN